jgi:hypothetical protein
MPTFVGDFFNSSDWERIAPWLGYGFYDDDDDDDDDEDDDDE